MNCDTYINHAPESSRQGQGLTRIASAEEKPPSFLGQRVYLLKTRTEAIHMSYSPNPFPAYFRYVMFSLSLPCHLLDEHRISTTTIPTFTPRVLQFAPQPIYEERQSLHLTTLRSFLQSSRC